MILLLLSGPVAAGKTSVREALVADYSFVPLKSSSYLMKVAQSRGLGHDRTTLQDVGDGLDQTTDFRWVIDDVAIPAINASPATQRWLVDAVRKERQVEHFKDSFGQAVLHVHLSAPEQILRERYDARLREGSADVLPVPYDIAIEHSNETAARGLIHIADFILDTSELSAAQCAQAIWEQAPLTGHLGLHE